jgi:cytochrome bd-type quinol oxidase subunit 1
MVSTGDGWFTLLGYMGLYAVLSVFFLYFAQRIITEGPGSADHAKATAA